MRSHQGIPPGPIQFPHDSGSNWRRVSFYLVPNDEAFSFDLNDSPGLQAAGQAPQIMRLTCAGYMGYPPDKLIVYLFRYLVL